MNTQKVEDVKDTALKLDEIRICRPEDYLLQKEEEKSRQLRKPPMQIPQLQ